MDHNSTAKQLRQYSQDLIAYKMGAEFADACNDAADALSNYSQVTDWLRRNGFESFEALAEAFEQVKRERDAAMTAVDRMAEYIVVFGLVDQFLCDDIPRELHLKHQPKDDGDYENGPCIECVKEYYLRGPQKET